MDTGPQESSESADVGESCGRPASVNPQIGSFSMMDGPVEEGAALRPPPWELSNECAKFLLFTPKGRDVLILGTPRCPFPNQLLLLPSGPLILPSRSSTFNFSLFLWALYCGEMRCLEW